jgi:hypothetical protein
MGCFPKIDQPCPLGIDEQKRIDGYCNRCAKQVHRLERLCDDDRRALLRNASGPICVSYRHHPVARGIGIGLGAAIAMSVSASVPVTTTPHAGPPTVQPQSADTNELLGEQSGSPVQPQVTQAESGAMELTEMVFVGGVSNPSDAEWIDDSDLPDLPMVSAQAQPDP